MLSRWYNSGLAQGRITDGVGEEQHIWRANELQLKRFAKQISGYHDRRSPAAVMRRSALIVPAAPARGSRCHFASVKTVGQSIPIPKSSRLARNFDTIFDQCFRQPTPARQLGMASALSTRLTRSSAYICLSRRQRCLRIPRGPQNLLDQKRGILTENQSEYHPEPPYPITLQSRQTDTYSHSI